eukprot:CAMPEP_0168399910 /NCGR_PEP_ID=MMETSP0228-20121227/22329_1 /TAXON_ID=133427 /ORGANISM="Protoceratium reticulatum, Strain CCCM 535 (=CCMP 1889)" /LENGTH=83 /DNA_ID=CAMNT_0008413441 /DNA_START=24 /DNA_END=271 /DNA_ORIENTATION=-
MDSATSIPMPETVLGPSLGAFEAYAVGLRGLLGNQELVTDALSLLLQCYSGCPGKLGAGEAGAGLGGESADASGETLAWCLQG